MLIHNICIHTTHSFNMKKLDRYVKVKGHSNWFLVYEHGGNKSQDLSSMQEKLLRSQVCSLHDDDIKQDLRHRLVMLATHTLDYDDIAERFGTILIRPSGTYTLLRGSEVEKEKYDNSFPIDNFSDIVICENDEKAEYKWVEYLKKRFPNEEITTINYFDLRNSKEIEKYFEAAKYITFSTTFSNLEWFEKMVKLSNDKHKIIGYCHDGSKWSDIPNINNLEIVKSL